MHQEKMVNPNSDPCGPVCGFGSRVGKQHQRGPKRALLGQREPVVNEMNRWLIPRELLWYEAERKIAGQ